MISKERGIKYLNSLMWLIKVFKTTRKYPCEPQENYFGEETLLGN